MVKTMVLRASMTFVVIASACSCRSRVTETEPIAECMDYARVAEPCFGSRAAARLRQSFQTPPRDEPSRLALQARCAEQRERVKRTCR